MSKRPQATAMLSRLRRPVGRLRDLPIWSKLGLIMIVPTLATIVVGTNGLVDHIATANNADRARTLSSLSADVGVLVHRLQDERAAATMLLSNNAPSAITANTAAYQRRFGETDQAKNAYILRRSGLADLPTGFRTLLGRLDNRLSELPQLRQQVAGRKDVSLTYATFFYRVVIADLLAIRDSSAQLAGETSLSDRMRAAAAVSSMKEYLSQERVVILRALGEGLLPQARQKDFIAALAGQEQAFANFAIVSTPQERVLYEQELAGDNLRLAEKYEGQVESALASGRLSELGFDGPKWDAAMRDRADLLRRVETSLDREMEQQATQLRDAVQRQVLLETGLLLGMLLLAILFAWLVARSMARSLRELRHGALAVAQLGLPQAVSRLRDPQLSAQMSPSQIAAQIAEPLPVRSRDEFGQVTEAFNAVHMEAVRTAAEQAALRSSVATMFVNLARRSQILVDRLIGHLDRLERGEEDPDRLAELFQLDHLATRMRRNDENLLVLAGADSTRIQREPASLIDVLRAAQSEVEHYTRIEFGVIDRDIEVASHAVNDVVHLVAELLDNATAFSPPDSAVIVEARRMGDQALLVVEDRGIGMSADTMNELNEKLATPPMVDVAVSRMMGLVVVARLAARLGIKVELRPGKDRGTIADVTLPVAVLVPRALGGRMAEGEGPSRPVTQGRPAIGASPLALESGPSLGGPAVGGPPRAPWVGDQPTRRPFEVSRPDERSPFEAPAAPSVPRMFEEPHNPRSLPAWSDLTGASGLNGSDNGYPGRSAPAGGDPLPQRRPNDGGRTVDGEVSGGPLIPRQLPTSPESRTNGSHTDYGSPTDYREFGDFGDFGTPPPTSAPPAAYQPPPLPGRPPRFGAEEPRPEAAAPPAWPPVGPTVEPPAPEPAPPAVPEEFVAALDMTAEFPRLSGEDSLAQAPYALSGENRPRFVDETMELPIFREVESAWFRTRRSVPDDEPVSTPIEEPPSPPRVTPFVVEPAVAPVSGAGAPGYGAPPVSQPQASPFPRRTPGATREPAHWETSADDGWRAAMAASEQDASEVTDSGLPKRVPMAQLVPGGIDKNANTAHKRTPEAVRGLLSAYHRGVQRGRQQQPKGPDGKTPEPTTAGPQTSQAGKEQEA